MADDSGFMQTLKDSFASDDDQDAKKRRLQLAMGGQQQDPSAQMGGAISPVSQQDAQASKLRKLQQFQEEQQYQAPQHIDQQQMAPPDRMPASSMDEQPIDEDEANSLGISSQQLSKYSPDQQRNIIKNARMKALQQMGRK